MAPSEDKKRKRKQQQQAMANVDGETKKTKKQKKPPKRPNEDMEANAAVNAKDTKKKKSGKKNNTTEEMAPAITGKRKVDHFKDPRFASVHFDPRFQRMPKHRSKVVIDSRFDSIFSDKSFATFSAPVDKRGKARKGKSEHPFRHYYMMDGDEPSKEKENFGFDGDDVTDGQLDGLEAAVSGEEDVSDSASDSSDTSSSGEDVDNEAHVNGDVAPFMMANHDDTPRTEEATRRLAVVNMDWDHINADDIYIIMSSCLPKDGHISSVAVYPSEYGLKCMEIEETSGPYALIYGDNKLDDEDDDDEDDHDVEVEKEKLRPYELNRLRYYYAVVDCDSSTTADHLYKNLDVVEISKTSNVLDLRFIPDSMDFSHPPRDITTEAPTNYKKLDFFTRALQHSNPEHTWDRDDPERKKRLQGHSNASQLDELECFLASDEEESDEETAELSDGEEVHKLKKKEKYLALLSKGDGSDAEDDGQDMEVTFNTGLEDIVQRIREKKDKKSETVWEAYLRRRKEIKRARKKNAKYSSEDDESDSDYQAAPEDPDQADDFFVDEMLDTETKTGRDSSKAKKRGHKDKGQLSDLDKEMEASQAELELLCANSNGRAENPPEGDSCRTKKDKKGKKLLSEDKLPKEDYHDDPRFSALFNSHLFALDPTDPQFKRSATYTRQMLQKQKHGAMIVEERKPSGQSDLPPDCSAPDKSDMLPDEISSKKDKLELMSLVRSVKRKTGSLKT